MAIGALTVSESPRWLALRGKVEESKQSLINIQGISKQEADVAVEEMLMLSQQISMKEGEASAPDSPLSKLQEI